MGGVGKGEGVNGGSGGGVSIYPLICKKKTSPSLYDGNWGQGNRLHVQEALTAST